MIYEDFDEKNYIENYNDDLELFQNDIDNTEISTFQSFYNFSINTIEQIKTFKMKTIDRMILNINMLIDSNLSYNNIIIEINNNYPKDVNPKIDALNEASLFLVNTYFKYKNKNKYRYGQEEAYKLFMSKMDLSEYWGLMIAPTGWGKSMMHYLFMGYFFEKNNKNILLITKRKDILTDVIKEIKYEIKKLKEKRMFPNRNIKICDQVNEALDCKLINSYTEYTVIIVNSDKLITRDKKNEEFNPKTLNKIHWNNFGLVLFDEVHWAGSTRTVQFMDYLKNKIKYGIGSSATPIRKSLQNQDNIKSLYGANYNIMYELSYKEAWEHNVILKIDSIMFPIYNSNVIFENKKDSKNTNYVLDVDNETKEMIVGKINECLCQSYRKKIIIFFRSRLSLLKWYKYFIRNNSIPDMKFYMSMTFSNVQDSEEKTTNDQVNRMIRKMGIDIKDITNGIDNFKIQENSAVLMVVNRANEGFNDPPVDICVNLDFTKNSNMLVTLQRMGRAQRLHGDKKKGYYLCPIISENMEEYKESLAKSIHNYIDAVTKDSTTSTNKTRHISKEVMTYILDSFKIEGIVNYTQEDIMIRISRYEKERDMTLDQFINILNIYNVKNLKKYNDIWENDITFKDRGMPCFPDKINNFSWSMVNDDEMKYYSADEIIDVVKDIYQNYTKEIRMLNSNRKRLDFLHNLDNRIPNQNLWEYYSINKKNLSFIFS